MQLSYLPPTAVATQQNITRLVKDLDDEDEVLNLISTLGCCRSHSCLNTMPEVTTAEPGFTDGESDLISQFSPEMFVNENE